MKCRPFNPLTFTLFCNLFFLGKEIISEVEVLQVDKKNRPLVDVKIFNSGELVPKSKVVITIVFDSKNARLS